MKLIWTHGKCNIFGKQNQNYDLIILYCVFKIFYSILKGTWDLKVLIKTCISFYYYLVCKDIIHLPFLYLVTEPLRHNTKKDNANLKIPEQY